MQYPEFIHTAKARLGVETETEVLDITRAFLPLFEHVITAQNAPK